MKKLKFGLAGLAIAALFVGPASAQFGGTPSTPKAEVRIDPVGVVSEDTEIELVAHKRAIYGKNFAAGMKCKLRAGDTVAILQPGPDGKQLVQRKSFQVGLKAPQGDSCPVGGVGTADASKANAWKKAAEAKDAAKKAGIKPPKT